MSLLKSSTPQDEKNAVPLHRDGDKRNELKRIGKTDIPPVPLVGGPLAGQVIHQPPEVAEAELVVGDPKDGKRAKYVSQGDGAQRKFVYSET